MSIIDDVLIAPCICKHPKKIVNPPKKSLILKSEILKVLIKLLSPNEYINIYGSIGYTVFLKVLSNSFKASKKNNGKNILHAQRKLGNTTYLLYF